MICRYCETILLQNWWWWWWWYAVSFCLIYYKLLFTKTQLLFKPHRFTDNNIVRSYKPINDKYKNMMWLSHHLFETMFVTRIQWMNTRWYLMKSENKDPHFCINNYSLPYYSFDHSFDKKGVFCLSKWFNQFLYKMISVFLLT